MKKMRFLPLALMALLLSACTITFIPGDVAVSGNVRFGIEVTDVIEEFRVDRGAGGSYRVGDPISFVVRTNRSGYITLTEIDTFGNVDTFGRNIPVNAGVTLISGPDSRSTFTIAGTSVAGVHRVRASFTPSQTDVSRIVYRGIVGESNWTSTIVTEVRGYSVRDIAETTFVIQ